MLCGLLGCCPVPCKAGRAHQLQQQQTSTPLRLPLPAPLPVFYFIVLLVALSSGVAPLKVAVEQLLGSALGIGLGLAGACCASLLGRAAWRVRHAGWMCGGAQGPVTQPAMAFHSQTTLCLVAGTCLDALQLVRALLHHSSPTAVPAAIYLIFAINGSSYQDTALKGVLMVLLSGAWGLSQWLPLKRALRIVPPQPSQAS